MNIYILKSNILKLDRYMFAGSDSFMIERPLWVVDSLNITRKILQEYEVTLVAGIISYKNDETQILFQAASKNNIISCLKKWEIVDKNYETPYYNIIRLAEPHDYFNFVCRENSSLLMTKIKQYQESCL